MPLNLRHMWKTSLLHIGLFYGMIGNSILAARADVTIENPLGQRTTSITDLVTSIIGQLTPVAVTIAVFAIIVVGFQFVFAAIQGEPGKIKDARKNLMWVLVGVGVIVSAKLLATAAKTFFSNL
ncbi:MAG: TrbC/VirB2 family protein [Candidatus Sungbacteria bacterium]|nr:TrbC/VirB2 family protein [Candidatus Sungbacteria bacterium]